MISTIVSRLVILVFGTLYPAYASYKAVRTKNVKEYVKWMMYWIVFALFTCAETFTDVFLSWFPFYYEIKIILVLWLLSPATKGSSILYRKFVHPMLSRREQEIDDYIAKAKEQGYHTVLNLGTKGVNYATTVIMQTAIKGGGGIVNQLRKSYSLSDLTDEMDARVDARALQGLEDEASDVVDPRHVRRRRSPRRSASGSSRVDMYFPEVDVRPGPSLGHVRSTEDVSSGYSSAEPLYVGQPPKLEAREGLVRTASVGGASRPRTRTTRTSLNTKKATTLPEDSEGSESEEEITIIQQISKSTQRIKRTIIVQEDGESSGNEFVDTIGFPADLIPQKIEVLEIPPQISEPVQETKITCNVIKTTITTDPIKIAESTGDTIPQKIEVLEIPSEIFESVQQANIPIKITEIVADTISQKIQEVVEITPNIIEPVQETNIKIKTDPIIMQDIVDESIQIKKELSVDIFEDSLETYESDNKTELTKNESLPQPEGSGNITSSDIDLISLSSLTQRGGKYNKHTAPPPPPIKKENDSPIYELAQNIIEPNIQPTTSLEKLDIESDSSETIYEDPTDSNYSENISIIPETVNEISESNKSIKATLVLKPGIIKNVGPPTEDSNKTPIFISQSPKVKRKSQSPITKLMMLPKKIFGSSNENLKGKRKSWHSETTSLTPSSEDLKSKSDTEDLYEPVGFSEKMSVSSTDINKRHEENKIVLRNLSHSPKQYRRKSKREDYDYDDSD